MRAEVFGCFLQHLGHMSKLANGDDDQEGGREELSDADKSFVMQFLVDRAGKEIPDDALHELAESLKLNVHSVESFIYGIAAEALSKQAAADDLIPGGKAKGMPASKFPADQLRMGVKVEKEHTPDPKKAKEISKDHLEEFPDYYTRLDKMEEEAKKAKEKTAFGSPLEFIGGFGPGAFLGYTTGREAAGQTAALTAPYGKKTRAEDIARKAAIPTSVLGALAAIYATRGAPSQRVTGAIARQFPKVRPQELELVEQYLLPAMAGLGGGAAAGAATGAASGLGARVLKKMGQKDKTAGGIPMVNPESLTPKGTRLLQQHSGSGPWDDLDLEEALATVDARTWPEYQREPSRTENMPGLMNKLRRTLGAGGVKPVYE